MTKADSDAGQLRLFDLPESGPGPLTFAPIRYPIWTENKARLIQRYLYYFVLITKHGTYIDGFAGPQEPDKPETWAAKLVVESEPRWLRNFHLCEKDKAKVQLLRELRDSQRPPEHKEPTRKIHILDGDFNVLVGDVLNHESLGESVAAFCLLDQRTFECDWSTLVSLAEHKSGRKIELFYFLATGWLPRAFAALQDFAIPERWWGGQDWEKVPSMNGEERARIFCQRFQNELGYRHAYAFPIYGKRSGGRVMYHMIHGSDHDEAPNLMARAYRKATGAPEPMEQLEFELAEWRATK